MGLFDIRSADSGINTVVTLVHPNGHTISASGCTEVNFAFLRQDGTCYTQTGGVLLDDGVYKLNSVITGDIIMTSNIRLQVQGYLVPSGLRFSTSEGAINVFRKLCS